MIRIKFKFSKVKMEEIKNIFQMAQSSSKQVEPNSRLTQYKIKHNTSNQAARRERRLEEQKLLRLKHVSNFRNLTEIESEDDLDDEPMEFQREKKNKKKNQKKNRKQEKKENQLMLSEWLIDVPNDLDTNWLFVLCPIGRRCSVVSGRGKTTAYSRNGYFIKQFSSHLPGGKRSDQKSQSTILDCIFSETEGIFYILDIMCWKGYPVYDSETEFRVYWRNDKCSESPEIGTKSGVNPYKFIPLQYYLFSQLYQVLSSFTVDIDGILFYHKRTHYTCGPTPLVNWLKPYMVPEILDISISEEYLKARPEDYQGLAHLIETTSKNKKKTGERENTMEFYF